jgi:hypothetical protein
MDENNYITEEVKSLIGKESVQIESCDPVERGSIRRFTQAIMDDDPLYWDDEYAAASRFQKIIAPPLFPFHIMSLQPSGTPDLLDQAIENPDYDGAGDFLSSRGLPEIPIPFKRLLNAGIEVECFKYSELGEKIISTSKYLDIYQKQGKKGPLIFVVMETKIKNDRDELLLIYKQTVIYR